VRLPLNEIHLCRLNNFKERDQMDYQRNSPYVIFDEKNVVDVPVDSMEILAILQQKGTWVKSLLMGGNHPIAGIVIDAWDDLDEWDQGQEEGEWMDSFDVQLEIYDQWKLHQQCSRQLGRFAQDFILEYDYPHITGAKPELRWLPQLACFCFQKKDVMKSPWTLNTFEAVAVYGYMNSVIQARGIESELEHCIGGYSPYAVFRAVELGFGLSKQPSQPHNPLPSDWNDHLNWVNRSCYYLIEKFWGDNNWKGQQVKHILGDVIEEAFQPQSN